MRIDIATLFPDMCRTVMEESIVGRAQRRGDIEVHCHNIRDYSDDRFKRVDDTPYGGGRGMVMQAQPLFLCCEAIINMQQTRPLVIYLSPKGRVFDQKTAVALSGCDSLLLVCGHYEGVDQRFIDEMVDLELSIGDFVLTGGELAALVVADAVARLCDGVLADAECYTDESHYNGVLEYPHYTRPPVWHGREVPPVLLSGHHKNIEQWRRGQSLMITRSRRPDMFSRLNLGRDDLRALAAAEENSAGGVKTDPSGGK